MRAASYRKKCRALMESWADYLGSASVSKDGDSADSAHSVRGPAVRQYGRAQRSGYRRIEQDRSK